jgi:hypothetical protein
VGEDARPQHEIPYLHVWAERQREGRAGFPARPRVTPDCVY